MRWKLAALLLMTTCAYGQGVRFDSNVFTSNTNVSDGAKSTVFTVPYAHITVCAYPSSGAPCSNRVPVYSNQALTQVIPQPVVADAHGRFGFWAPPGTYAYSAVDSSETLLGTYAFTLGGTGGGSATFPGTPGLIYGLNAATGRNATASDVVGLFAGCTGSKVLQADGTCGTSGTSVNLTTTGTSGPATLIGGTLNIPQYDTPTSYFPGTATVTVAGSPAIGQVLTATNSTHAAWATPTSGGGSGTLSGQTTGYVPLATSATASTTSSVIEQTTSGLTVHAPGNTHSIQFAASSVPAVPGATKAIIASDSSGNLVASDNGGALGRVCTPANGVCSGGNMIYPGAGVPVSTGTAWSTSKATPTGAFVGTTDTQTLTNKSLTAPDLGTPTVAVLTNATGLPLTSGTTGLLPVSKGGTGTATPGIVAGTNVTVSGTWPNQTVNSTGGGSAFADTIDATPISAINSLQVIANNVISPGSKFAYTSDVTPGYYAGSAYIAYGEWIDDYTLTVIQNPGMFTAADIMSNVTKFLATANGNGQTALALGTDGVTVTSTTSGNAPTAIYRPADSWATLPQLCYVHYQKTGSTSCYSAIVTTAKAGSTYNPRNGTTHLMTVTAGTNEYVCGYAFQEVARNTGDVANCNVFLAMLDSAMGAMATAAGDSTNATYFANELTQIKTGLAGGLTDSTTHMLIFATGQNSGNLDFESSALACWYNNIVPGANILPLAQCKQISDYFHNNLGALTHNGFVLSSQASFSYIGATNGGGPPYIVQPSGFGANEYQDHSYWSVHSGWFAYTLSLNHPGDIPAFLASARDAANPAWEWYNNDFSTTHASPLNMESPQGFAWAARNISGPTAVAAGAACTDIYGAIVNGSCSSGSTLTPPVTINGASNNVPLTVTSSSTVNTAFAVGNSTSNTNFDLVVNGSGSGAYAGNAALLLANSDGSSPLAPMGFDRVHFNVQLGDIWGLRWNSGATGGSPTDVGIRRSSAGHIILDGATQGDGLGVCDNCTKPFSYGTPAITGGVAGASFAPTTPPSGWPLNDHLFTLVMTPTATVNPSTVIAIIAFGKTWKDASGNNQYANCVMSPVLPSAGGVGMYAINSQSGTELTIGTGASQTLTSGTTYAWAVQCNGTTEQ